MLKASSPIITGMQMTLSSACEVKNGSEGRSDENDDDAERRHIQGKFVD